MPRQVLRGRSKWRMGERLEEEAERRGPGLEGGAAALPRGGVGAKVCWRRMRAQHPADWVAPFCVKRGERERDEMGRWSVLHRPSTAAGFLVLTFDVCVCVCP